MPLIILPMKIAIASSGLGHVARGIETWALDSANALHRQGCDVTLFAAGAVESEASVVVVPCIRRRTHLSDLIVKLLPSFTWRWGLQSGYGIEQLTFWRHLKKHLNRGQYDVLHIQDPMIADLCRKDRAAGRVSAKEILAHGTEEPLEFLSHFDYLQHLAPWHLEQALKQLEGEGKIIKGKMITPSIESLNHSAQNNSASLYPFWTALPNFIDTELYRPVRDVEEKRTLRRKLGIPEDAFVLGTAAAIKKHHKRIDYLIREFAQFYREREGRMILGQNDLGESSEWHVASDIRIPSSRPSGAGANDSAQNDSAFLVIAGSRQNDTAALQALAEELCPGRIMFLINHPHEQMPDLLRCFDAFVLTSIFEMMPIALLEAIGTGLPVITNRHPVLEWMGGAGGIRPDMGQDGALSATLTAITPETIETLGAAAREHALANYSEDAVIAQYLAYYERILAE